MCGRESIPFLKISLTEGKACFIETTAVEGCSKLIPGWILSYLELCIMSVSFSPPPFFFKPHNLNYTY